MTRVLIAAAAALMMDGFSFTGVASAAPEENPSQAKYECSDGYMNNSEGGANNDDGYQSTCSEEDFGGNGQELDDHGGATGKPCAGCVGMADDKNPPGQHPDGSDDNSGYECDGRDRPFEDQKGNGNHGVGDENPAHTGCESEASTTTETCPDGSAMPTTDRNGDGEVDADDCDVDDRNGKKCPDGSAMPTTDRNGDGKVNTADCELRSAGVDDDDDDAQVEDEGEVRGETLTRPDAEAGGTAVAAPATGEVVGEPLQTTAGQELPRTGPTALLPLAGLLIGSGAVLTALSRRRTS